MLICAGRTFIAGADISEFGKPPKGASLPELQAAIEGGPKPVIAAIHGTALGGGFEVALMCHYRVAVPSAKFGLPEIKLGLIPGAGGTQRLPRLIGVENALEVILSGAPFSAKQALEWGVVDELVEEGKLRDGAIAFARKVIDTHMPLRKIRDLNDKVEAARGHPEIFEKIRNAKRPQVPRLRSLEVRRSARCEAAVDLPFDEGMKRRAPGVSRSHPDAAIAGPALRVLRRAQGLEDRRRAGRHAGICRSKRSASSAPAPWAAASR